MENANFDTEHEYYKLKKTLYYLRDLDKNVVKLTEHAEGFDFLIKFTTNQDMIKVVERAFNRIKEDDSQFGQVK